MRWKEEDGKGERQELPAFIPAEVAAVGKGGQWFHVQTLKEFPPTRLLTSTWGLSRCQCILGGDVHILNLSEMC